MHFHNLLLPIVAAPTVLAASIRLRVISFNIRYAAKDLQANELAWWDDGCPSDNNLCRFFHLSNQIGTYVSDYDAAVVGLQEVWNNQLMDILGNLGAGWSHIGVGRDDGENQGEKSPILYNSNKMSVIFSETKWLSPDPDDVGSFGWGAGSRRIVTLGVFEHKTSGRRFIHANTHLDNVSGEARTEGIRVVIQRIESAQQTYGPLAVTLTGDFNADPNGDAYQALLKIDYLKDSWDTARHVGTNQLTYSGFSDKGSSRIDFVWYGPNNDSSLWTPEQTEIVSNKVNGVYVSDHRLIYADLILN